MDFHAEFHPKPFPVKIEHHQKLLLAGSCFTEQIGNKLAAHKFNILQNPHGILFNPASLSTSIISYCNEKKYEDHDLFYHNELWNSWQHHSRFSDIKKEDAIVRANAARPCAAWLT